MHTHTHAHKHTYTPHSLKHTLEAAADSKAKNEGNAENEGPTRKHENHQLEVEVMLYRFKQPVAEVGEMWGAL